MSKARAELLKRVNYWLAPWCRCICREAPDGTMCKLCGHAHPPITVTRAKEKA